MSIYIKDMEMPKGCSVCIVIDAAGQARHYDLNNDRYADNKLFEAVHVPPHGRLKDYDKIIDQYLKWFRNCKHREYDGMYNVLQTALDDAPTIIPAEEETE